MACFGAVSTASGAYVFWALTRKLTLRTDLPKRRWSSRISESRTASRKAGGSTLPSFLQSPVDSASTPSGLLEALDLVRGCTTLSNYAFSINPTSEYDIRVTRRVLSPTS